jgi:hypothetical protein
LIAILAIMTAKLDATLHRIILTIAIASMARTNALAQRAGKKYSAVDPLSSYLEIDDEAEIVLARSAAPRSISDSAEILVFGLSGYHRGRSGSNGWTCVVQRSWTDAYDNAEFWNPKIRVPICFNAPASRSVLPVYLDRTKWVIAKRSLPEIITESHRHSIPDPLPGSFAMMMSKHGYLADGVGAAAPHVMFFLPRVPQQDLGANLPGSPVGATPGDKPAITIFYLPSRTWSDGVPFVPAPSASH